MTASEEQGKRFNTEVTEERRGVSEKDRGIYRTAAEGAEKTEGQRLPGAMNLNRPLQI
jgi:hypothetical protein